MATARLAISCPQVGIRSETFIRRHIEVLAPGATVVVATKPIPVSEEVWSVDCPVYRIRHLPPAFSRRVKEGFVTLLGRESREIADRGGMVSFLKDQQVEIMLAEYLDDAWSLLGVARGLGIRFFAHAHGYDLASCYRDSLWRKRYAEFDRAEGIIVVNRVMKERLTSLGVGAEKIHIVPCGVAVPEQPLKRPLKDQVRCLAVGRMVPKKGPLQLMEAFRQAVRAYPKLSLDYVGTGPLFPEVRQFIENHGLSASVTLHGGQSHQSVMKLMEMADIFVQHSMVDPVTGDEEGMPVAVQEAMANSLPVVSTWHAGIPDAVVSGTTGLLVAEGDSSAMAKQLLSLTHDSGLREAMGRAAWQRAAEQFTWQRERDALRTILAL